jgi:pimeloyl-ACP methyl ester carboxylesterase
MPAPHLTATPRTSRRGCFWLPGEIMVQDGREIQRGAAFVAWEAPAEDTGLLPVILIHGGGGQGTEWQVTPDGRPGWAPLLVDRGHPVYVIDRPGFGRSPGDTQVYGPTTPPPDYDWAVGLFAARGKAATQTGWPWSRESGAGPIDQIVAASAPVYLDTALMNRLDGDRVADLIDVIGRCIIIAASAGGPAGVHGMDRRPGMVAAYAGIESLGPAFKELGPRGRLSYGLSAASLSYDPPVATPEELRLETLAGPEANPAGNAFVLQAEPARALPRLAGVPVGIFSTDSSDRHVDDEYSVAFLRQAGVAAEQIRFADHGVTGHGHGIMFESDNAAALDVVLTWLHTHLP